MARWDFLGPSVPLPALHPRALRMQGAVLPPQVLSDLQVGGGVRSELSPEDQTIAPPAGAQGSRVAAHLSWGKSGLSLVWPPQPGRQPQSRNLWVQAPQSLSPVPSPTGPGGLSIESVLQGPKWSEPPASPSLAPPGPNFLDPVQRFPPLGPSSPHHAPQGGGPTYYKTPLIFSSKAFIDS